MHPELHPNQLKRIYRYPELKASGIYQMLNMQNGKCYVGEAEWAFYRVDTHMHLLNRGKHSSRLMQADWVEYGADAFTFVLLRSVVNRTARLHWEAHYIALGGFDLYNNQQEIRRCGFMVRRAEYNTYVQPYL